MAQLLELNNQSDADAQPLAPKIDPFSENKENWPTSKKYNRFWYVTIDADASGQNNRVTYYGNKSLIQLWIRSWTVDGQLDKQ